MLFTLQAFRRAVAASTIAAGSCYAQFQEPQMPVADGSVEIYSNTLLGPDPWRLLDYPRSVGEPGSVGVDHVPGSHLDTLSYDGPEPTFYQRNRRLFSPIDTVFGLISGDDVWDFEENTPEMASLAVDVRNFRNFDRPFAPETSTLKLGPLYLDLLYIGAGVVYSDFNSDDGFARFQDDGWTGFVDFGVRSLLRISDNFYMSSVAQFMYLPFKNKIALRYGVFGEPIFFTRFEYKKKIGDWDFMLYDQLRGNTGFGFNFDVNQPENDRAGRYVFGIVNDRNDEFFDDNTVIVRNSVGMRARRLVFDNQWHLLILADHTDFWQSFDFEQHRTRDLLIADLGYEGIDIPFAPRFRYQMLSNDGFDSMRHQISLRLLGRITENLRWTGVIGENFTTGTTTERDRFLWELGLEHHITAYTKHWIRVGENFFYNEFSPETITARFVRYGIEQRLDSRLSMLAFTQYSDREVVNNENQRERLAVGLSLLFRPLDYTKFRATAMYEQINPVNVSGDLDRWLYRVEMLQQLGLMLDASLFYQYEERQAVQGSFTEHVAGMSVRRTF